MKPVIGVSKNLGHGFRVGIALPLVPEPKRSKREEANEKFIRDARSRLESAVVKYLFSHGMLVTPGTMHRLPPDAAEKINGPIESIEQNIKAVGDALRIYNDTGSIQQSTKERIMRNIYEVERVTSANAGGSNLLNQADFIRADRMAKHNDGSTLALFIIASGIAIGLTTSSWWPALTGVVAGCVFQIKHQRHAEAERGKRFKARLAEVEEMIVAGSVTLEDYVTGRV